MYILHPKIYSKMCSAGYIFFRTSLSFYPLMGVQVEIHGVQNAKPRSLLFYTEP